jgi:hypothetical protein
MDRMNGKNTYYVSARGDSYYEVQAKNLTSAKVKASKIYQKSSGGRFSVYEKVAHPNGQREYLEVAYWSGNDWAWHNAV